MPLDAEYWVKIASAVDMIKAGDAEKIELRGITVYRCGTVIRIDIKETKEGANEG